jgi:hypothetical protein
MRLLCVGRHSLLSDHLASVFRELGAETRTAVGLAEAADVARLFEPRAVVCDYDLLATVSLDEWERDPLLGRVPIVAVSLTRRPDEVHVLDVNNVAGFIYLPALEREDGERLVAALAREGASSLVRPPRRDTPESVAPTC